MVLNKKLIPCILQLKTQIKIILNLSKYPTSLLYQITWFSLTQFLSNMESFYTSDNLNLIYRLFHHCDHYQLIFQIVLGYTSISLRV